MSNLAEGRDPAKRKVKPAGNGLGFSIAFDLPEGESSDDSDFRIEDHPEESDDYSVDTEEDAKKEDNSESTEGDSESEEDVFKSTDKNGKGNTYADLLEQARTQEFKYPGDLANVLICAGCLGSRSDDYNEIVECDGCGVTVHEGCYGVSDVTSESSTVSSASTEPWFCEACKAGVKDPTCELCPNPGGIFKETEVGAWVHLVCALYVPGVAFSDVERLSGVTLFEMAYSRWGARACALCVDAGAARTGVAVGCDAGLCRSFFHVTCGQREGLLAEAHSEEAEQADPFYAHCRLHSDRALVNKRKRNWRALQLRSEMRRKELEEKLSEEEKKRIQRKLIKYRRKYQQIKDNRNPPWVPTQKMARMLYSSAGVMRKFQHKAELMGVDLHALEFQESQMSALREVWRRWHVPPAFSVEFVAYFLERNARTSGLRRALLDLTAEHRHLRAHEDRLSADHLQASRDNSEALAELKRTRDSVQKLYDAIMALCPSKTLPEIVRDTPLLPPEVTRSTPKVTPHMLQKRGSSSRAISVPTAAALKMGVGFPLSDHPDARQGKVLSTSAEASVGAEGGGAEEGGVEERGGGGGGAGGGAEGDESGVCAVCARSSARHVLAACDSCPRHYHPHCLRPPLQRPPKKTKLYGWQCSECDKSSDSEPEVIEKKVPRRSRIRYSKEGIIVGDPPSPGCTTIPAADDSKAADNHQPIKVTIKPFEFSSDGNESSEKKKGKKIKRTKQKTSSGGELSDSSAAKQHKRSFTSPTLTNTPLMSITPIVADSPGDSHNSHHSHNDNSNASTALAQSREDASFLSPNSTFSSLLADKQDKKSRDSKTIESSIETTLANLSSDIATYKANRKRRKEKHRSRYSPDLLRTPSKHKHKRKKKMQDMENPGPHPRITIKIKPIPKPDGSLDTQMFYVPTDSNDGLPPNLLDKTNAEGVPSPLAATAAAAVDPATPPLKMDEELPKEPVAVPQVVIKPLEKPKRERVSRGRGGEGGRGDVGAGAGAGGEPGRAAAAAQPPLTHCDVCNQSGAAHNLVRCDECFKRYHFTCLEPPLNKNPKKRGYSWHCADCDPTDNEATT